VNTAQPRKSHQQVDAVRSAAGVAATDAVGGGAQSISLAISSIAQTLFHQFVQKQNNVSIGKTNAVSPRGSIQLIPLDHRILCRSPKVC
jgi:hypothetical protein